MHAKKHTLKRTQIFLALWKISQEAEWRRKCHVDGFLISPSDKSLFREPAALS